MKGLTTAIAVFMLTALAYAQSSSAIGHASAVIAVPSGISSTSSLEGALPSSTEKSFIQPAQFSVSGAPYQTFSVALSESTLTETAQGIVVLTNFVHTAGVVPVIGPTGKSVFSVLGQARRPVNMDSFVGDPSSRRFNVTVTYN